MWWSDERSETKQTKLRHPPSLRHRRANRSSAGARRASETSSCGCCEVSIEAIARQVGLEPYRLEQWRERALAALESALKERPQTPGRTGHGERTAARENRSPGGWRAFSPAKVAQMSAAISPATGRSYGVQRVCRVRALPRSSFYHAANRNQAPLAPARRGPAPPQGCSMLAAGLN